MKMTRQQVRVGAVLIAASSVAVACTSSGTTTSKDATTSGGSSGGPAKSYAFNTKWDTAGANAKIIQALGGAYPKVSGSTTRGVTDTSINVGAVWPITVNGSKTPGGTECDGIKARLDRANNSKELKHRINWTGCADGAGDPATTQNATLAAIKQKNDFALFGGTTDGAAMEKSHVVYLGSHVACGTTSPFSFVAGGVYACPGASDALHGKLPFNDGFIISQAKVAGVDKSQLKWAGFSDNNPANSPIVKGTGQLYQAEGVQVVGVFSSLPANSAVTVDLTPYVAPVLNAKPNDVGMVMSDQALQARVIGALRQGGFKGPIFAGINPAQMKDPTLGQLLSGETYTQAPEGFPAFGGRYWDTVLGDAKAAGVEDTNNFNDGWVQADLFVQAVKDFEKTGQPLTTENLANMMNDSWTYAGYGDVAAPDAFPYEHFSTPPCSAAARMSTKTDSGLEAAVDIQCGTVTFP